MMMTVYEQHQLSFVYKVGVLRSKTVTNVGPTDYRWTISADKAKMLFSASSKYSNFIVSTSANTWNDETEVRTTRTVQKGKSDKLSRPSILCSHHALRKVSLQLLPSILFMTVQHGCDDFQCNYCHPCHIPICTTPKIPNRWRSVQSPVSCINSM